MRVPKHYHKAILSRGFRPCPLHLLARVNKGWSKAMTGTWPGFTCLNYSSDNVHKVANHRYWIRSVKKQRQQHIVCSRWADSLVSISMVGRPRYLANIGWRFNSCLDFTGSEPPTVAVVETRKLESLTGPGSQRKGNSFTRTVIVETTV